MQSLKIPPIVFGTSALGNLFVASDESAKHNVVKECIAQSDGIPFFDSAGKYGAGLALETLGNCLRKLNIKPKEVIISNKLGWLRTELKTKEPTFEPGVWKDLRHDAIQKINYDGILECFEQGNELLNGFTPQLVSVHDPDEYLAKARDNADVEKLYDDILQAYRALQDLKRQGKVIGIGVGAKDWRIISKIAEDVPLDWVMIANSLTIKNHPKELVDFVANLAQKGVYVINSAVFHSGFLVGGDYYDYRLINPEQLSDHALLNWRDEFFQTCGEFSIKPAEACVQFALKFPGVESVALNTTSANRVKENVQMLHCDIPRQFWETLRRRQLIRDM